MTLGEERVRLNFNPSADNLVSQIKLHSANLIDRCNVNSFTTDDPEAKRLWSLAMTAYEEAAMWAVKAATI